MPPCLAVNISEGGRCRLSIALTLFNWICVSISLALLGFGGWIQFVIQNKLYLIEQYKGDVIPYFFLGVGGLMFLINIIGGKVCLNCSRLETREAAKKFLLPMNIVSVFALLGVLAAGLLCFGGVLKLEDSFDDGIRNAMKNYKDGGEIKKEMDELQLAYKCCGADGYTDWFKVSWINENYLNVNEQSVRQKMSNGIYINDDVPFSCCNPESERPCIHHHVHDNSKHFKYNYQTGNTLHGTGCTEALMTFFADMILMNVGFTTIGAFGVQLILLILTRYLQTSIDGAYEKDPEDPTATTIGYLFNCPCGGAKEDGDSETKEELLKGTSTNPSVSPSKVKSGSRRSSKRSLRSAKSANSGYMQVGANGGIVSEEHIYANIDDIPEQPAYEQPAYEQPAYEQPVYDQQAYQQPYEEYPAY
ncbi:unnamed protein product [Owenia fusiformis]|uniref:Uncharacterized protein n=1 Tax=Owenia fusiformis TaxID=6347 RepID=A0A8J1XX84_OWEFU|nr:unnamed protein product [Owenia fusiformis]